MKGGRWCIAELLWLFTLSTQEALASPSCSGPVVSTRLGKVRGFRQRVLGAKAVSGFTSIPFAKPPVGELRFKKPEPAEPWTDVLNATTPHAACMQADVLSPRFLTYGTTLFTHRTGGRIEAKKRETEIRRVHWLCATYY